MRIYCICCVRKCGRVRGSLTPSTTSTHLRWQPLLPAPIHLYLSASAQWARASILPPRAGLPARLPDQQSQLRWVAMYPPPWCTGLPVHSYPTSSPNRSGLLYHTTFLLLVALSSRLPRGRKLTTPPSTKHHMNQPQGRRAGKTLSSCSIDAPHPIAAGDPGE